MPNYNFETLNDKDFEELVRDLLQEELQLTLESFKKGKDKGIDLKYSKATTNTLIVQAKHWRLSGISRLKDSLQTTELPKIKSLSPERYILVTSLGLSPTDKESIMKILSPFIKGTGDIYGKDDINNLIGKFPEVEKRHFKLWLSSTTILQEIFNNAVLGRSEFEAEQIVKKIRLFVYSPKYNESVEILNNSKFLVITGSPGIGKTTLAKFLIYKFLADKFQLIYIRADESLSVAEDIISRDPNDKQIIYIDDFLGANYFQIINPQNSDKSFLEFIERVKKSPNKFLILTTRTNVLNKAKESFKRFDSAEFNIGKYEIEIADYDIYTKGRILYNHLFFSSLDEDYLKAISEKGNFWKIIEHPNFNPRIIEFVTNSLHLENINSQNYLDFILSRLDRPDLIWEEPYETQTNQDDKLLIQTLFSLSDEVSESTFLEIFNARIEYEVKVNGYQKKLNLFYSTLRNLLDGFIISSKDHNGINYYRFFNPSIVDFLITRLNDMPEDKWEIIKSAVYIEQLESRFHITHKGYVLFHPQELGALLTLLRDKLSNIKMLHNGSLELEKLSLLTKWFSLDLIQQDIENLLDKMKLDEITNDQFHKLYILLICLNSVETIKSQIIGKWNSIVTILLSLATNTSELLDIKELFSLYDIDYSEFLSNDSNKSIIQSGVNEFWQREISTFITDHSDLYSVYEKADLERVVQKIYEEASDINYELEIEDSPSFDEIWYLDLEDQLQENLSTYEQETYEADLLMDEPRTGTDLREQVNELFNN